MLEMGTRMQWEPVLEGPEQVETETRGLLPPEEKQWQKETW